MKSIIKPIVTGAFLITGTALAPTSASADADDVGKVILGVAGIAVLAAILDKQKSKAESEKQVTAIKVAPPKLSNARRSRVDYQQCLRQRRTQSGWQTYVSNRCVNRLNRDAKLSNGPKRHFGHHRQGRFARR